MLVKANLSIITAKGYILNSGSMSPFVKKYPREIRLIRLVIICEEEHFAEIEFKFMLSFLPLT